MKVGRALITALKNIDTRVIVVDGAGSLYVDEAQNTKLIDTSEFPEIFIPTAKGQVETYKIWGNHKELHGLSLGPSANFDAEGPKTGKYQTGKDILLINSNGNSYVSYEDFSIALVDEIENPKNKSERFTVGSEEKWL